MSRTVVTRPIAGAVALCAVFAFAPYFAGADQAQRRFVGDLPPVCIAGPDQTLPRQGDFTTFLLDGSASFDPLGEAITFEWASCPGSVLTDPTEAMTMLIVPSPAGEVVNCGARLVVRDKKSFSVCRLFVTVVGDQEPAVCLVIIDEDTIDNGVSTIEAAAASHSVSDAWLVNDDMPTETSNPPLRWNQHFPGDVVLLPGGQVDDEGLFALPPDPPFDPHAYWQGTVPQSQLDPIHDVMPLRNHELYALIGLTCTGVVYDSDISMNYGSIQGNLQGGRLGTFTFTVLDVVVPGSIPESQSSTDLYDLLVRVESPAAPTNSYQVQIRDHEPDSIELTRARYTDSTGLLQIWGESDFSPGAVMTCSVDGFFLEEPMTWTGSRYELSMTTPVDLDGRRVLISTDAGGSYNGFVE